MKTRVIQDGDLIEMTRKQIDSISVIAEQLKLGVNGKPIDELGRRLEAYVIGLRKTIDLLETRIARAR
jgi:hypothetical protein